MAIDWEYMRGVWRERFEGWGKIVVILALLAAPAAGIAYLLHRTWRSVDEGNPHPTSSQVAVTQFFTSIQNEADELYPGAYRLLPGQAKAAVIAGLNSREVTAVTFDRIRSYLVATVGDDFLATMEIDEKNPGMAWFGGRKIAVRLDLQMTKSPGDDRRFGVRQVADFPHDVAPMIQGRNRALDEMMYEDEPAVVIASPAELYEFRTAPPLRQLMAGYEREKMLDCRHALLEYMIYHYGEAEELLNFLQYKVLRTELSPQLQRIAREHLGIEEEGG